MPPTPKIDRFGTFKTFARATVATGLFTGLICLYGHWDNILLVILAASLTVATVGVSVWFIGIVGQTVPNRFVKTGVTATVLLLGLAMLAAYARIAGARPFLAVLLDLPLYLLFSFLLSGYLRRKWSSEVFYDQVEHGNGTVVPIEQEKRDTISTVSVKDGVKISIVDVEDIVFFQSCGDYVTIHTDQGKFIKEKTMKYFEEHLPASFVRIHRSYIVASDRIVRIELLGKETYKVHLRGGIELRASAAGYRNIKSRLAI